MDRITSLARQLHVRLSCMASTSKTNKRKKIAANFLRSNTMVTKITRNLS